MDRLQAGDLKSYLAMQAPVAMPDVALIPKTDEAELKQLMALGGAQGLGYDLNDDSEFGDTLSEFGIDAGLYTKRDGS